MVWRDETVVPYPEKGYINKNALATLQEEFDLIGARGSSNAPACMTASLAKGADQVIFVTAKSDMDSSLVQDLLADKSLVKRVDGIKIDSDSSVLEEMAKETNGLFRSLSGSKLQELVE